MPENDFIVHHIGVAVADMTKAIQFYQEAWGFVVISGPIADPIQKAVVAFVGRSADDSCPIELITPLESESPINRYLAKGIGAYHLCYQVSSLESALAKVRAYGCLLISKPVPAAAFDNRRIAWFYTPTNQLVELLEDR